MTGIQDGGAASSAAPQKSPATDDGFFTEEQLADVANFNFEQRTLLIPELDKAGGGRRVGLRELTVGEHESLTRHLPSDPENWKRVHTAMSLAMYVDRPKLSEKRWEQLIAPMPSSALARINREIFDIVNLSDEEEASAGVAFPAGDASSSS